MKNVTIVASLLGYASSTLAAVQQSQYSIFEGASSDVTLQVQPNDVCVQKGDTHGRYNADETGELLIAATAAPNSAGTMDSFQFDCVSGSYVLNIVVDSAVSSSPQAAPPLAGRYRNHGQWRPPLTGVLDSYGQSWLAAHGYPLRPEKTSAFYGNWVKDVTTGNLMLDPTMPPAYETTDVIKPIPNTLSVPVQNTLNWCGIVAAPGFATGQFGGVWGAFKVPFMGAYWGTYTHMSSEWVGIDGNGSVAGDLLQNGFRYYQGGGCSANPSVSIQPHYFTWYFTAPTDNSHGEWDVNFPVHAGDQVLIIVGATDASGNVNPAGGYQMSYWSNASTNPPVSMKIFRQTGIKQVPCKTAEWIFETPEIDSCDTYSNYADMYDPAISSNLSQAHTFLMDSTLATLVGGTGNLPANAWEDTANTMTTNHGLNCCPGGLGPCDPVAPTCSAAVRDDGSIAFTLSGTNKCYP
ncbi:MAG TPA: G1 family glutamic endopeptidase [Polyangiaceae bacterium]|nr:G1 family glutamic endopeptidase [Polyangiaceae bacterium]